MNTQRQYERILATIFGDANEIMDVTVGAYGLTSKDELVSLARAIKSLDDWEEFNAQRVGEWLEGAVDKIAKVRFGREYSPVMYVQLSKWDRKTQKRAAESALIKRMNDLVEFGQKGLGAQEADASNPENFEVRLWWD